MSGNGLSRRRLLGVTAGAATVSVAGCTASDDDDDPVEQELDPADWEAVDEIRLEGHTNGWIGEVPDLIAGVRNPTLLLSEGREYEFTWENRDGIPHNIEIRNDENGVVGDYRTRSMGTRGETQTLEIEATNAMHQYVCAPHPRSMTGYIHVVE